MRTVVGDATRPEGDGPKVLAHVCNDLGLWGAGFVLAVSARWPGPERDYLKTHAAGGLALGSVRFVEVGGSLTVASMVAMHGVRRVGKKPPIRYDALREALSQVAVYARERQASVHMPRIACGLAGGRWQDVEPIITSTLAGLAVTVYDLA
ncbi:MAG TPA: macro domain-containing protein [Planctomycetota bacterium]